MFSADKDVQPKVVHRRQLFDLNQSAPPSVGRNSVDGLATVPSFLHNNRNFGSSSSVDLDTSDNLNSAKGTATHHYNTRAKRKATAPVRPVAVEKTITCL